MDADPHKTGLDRQKKKKRYNIAPNVRRNNALYREWQFNRTIEQAAIDTGIPRSTVGYYFKKFDDYAREARPIPLGPEPRIARSLLGSTTDSQQDPGMKLFLDTIDSINSILDERIAAQIRDLEAQGKINDVKELLHYNEVKKRFENERMNRIEKLPPWQRMLLLYQEATDKINALNLTQIPQSQFFIKQPVRFQNIYWPPQQPKPNPSEKNQI